MSAPTRLRGRPLADDIVASVRSGLDHLRRHGVTPTLGTVLMSDDEAAVSFMDRKHERCQEVGVATKRIDRSPEEPAAALYDAVERLADDEEVTALFVQVPLPDHVDAESVGETASAITPVPGGVGPLTLACMLRNVVDLAARQAGLDPAELGDSE